MEKFKTFKSKICPVNYSNVDTDMLIPAQYLTSTSKDGYGQNLFRRMRDENKDFSLNQDRYKDAQILIADDNFGCGSSREHAVWALTDWGFKVIIAKSFSDIFFSNSAKNGLLLITLDEKEVDSILSKEELTLSVNLEEQKVVFEDGSDAGRELSFEYDSFRKHCLLQGLDDIDYILSEQEQIKEFRDKQAK